MSGGRCHLWFWEFRLKAKKIKGQKKEMTGEAEKKGRLGIDTRSFRVVKRGGTRTPGSGLTGMGDPRVGD